MKVMLAKSAGFCFGVRRAVQLAEKIAAGDAPYVMLGPVIHNDHVIEHLAEQGVGCVERVDQVPPGCGVIIRSHGEGKAVYDKLQEMGCPVADATCVKVAKIHQIVQDASRRGRQVIIIGDPVHPEVTAIAGWCTGAKIFRNATELGEFLKEYEENPQKPITLVSQTTSTDRIWSPCREKVKKECTNAEIFDTICDATCMRQSEAQSLAEQCDAMIVIGDRKSSNTTRLAELCRAHCPLVYHISRAEELDRRMVSGVASVGITAGASTPGWIIKEVNHKMSEENNNNAMEIEESFADMLEKSIKTLNTGDKVTGVVTGITPSEVNVDLGTKHAGYIPISELTDDPSVKPEDIVKVGDTIETYYYMGIKQQFLKKKLDLSIMCNNPFEKYRRNRSTSDTPTFGGWSEYRYACRSLYFRVSYRFGKQNVGVKRTAKSIRNDDMSSGAQGGGGGSTGGAQGGGGM